MSVSIITPNYNNASYVEQYLQSLLADPAVSEIVVWDNASTDGSAEMYERLGQPKIRVIRSPTGVGATMGRHGAVQASSNELICFLDGDDWLAPNSVSMALKALHADNLDVALFRYVEVDPDGRHPIESVPMPDRPIDGRTATERTMGGWGIHCAGVMRKALYERAWQGFHVHGWLSDEVLTRRLLLLTERVGGSEGKMFYRRIHKMLAPQQFVDWGRTTVRSLALGLEAGLSARPMRLQRRMTVRFLFGLTRRALVGKMPRTAVGALLDEYFAVPRGGWALADAPWMLVERLLLLARPMLR